MLHDYPPSYFTIDTHPRTLRSLVDPACRMRVIGSLRVQYHLTLPQQHPAHLLIVPVFLFMCTCVSIAPHFNVV
jgi:hypothetical protein